METAVTIPAMRTQRFNKLCNSKDPVIKVLLDQAPIDFKGAARPKLACGKVLITKEDIEAFQTEKLYMAVDTAGLSQAKKVPQVMSWTRNPDLQVPSGDYIKAIQIRAASVATRSKEARGNRGSNLCPTCRDQVANLGHILQRCPRVHGRRVVRHDVVVEQVATHLRADGYALLTENRIPIGGTIAKPDIIAWKGNEILIIDPSITSDRRDIEMAHLEKVEKYTKNEIINWAIKSSGITSRRPTVIVEAIIMNWRGIMAPSSHAFLRETLGWNRKRIDELIIMTLVESWKMWSMERLRM